MRIPTLDAGKVFMGGALLIAGVGVGYWMHVAPEGMSSQWGLWGAEFVATGFALSGVYVIADAFGCSRLAIRCGQILLVGMLVLLHWIAYFGTSGECTASFSFLNTPSLIWPPDFWVCRFVVRVSVMALDAGAIILAAQQGWRWWRRRRNGWGTM